jgi:hypothetical protein
MCQIQATAPAIPHLTTRLQSDKRGASIPTAPMQIAPRAGR